MTTIMDNPLNSRREMQEISDNIVEADVQIQKDPVSIPVVLGLVPRTQRPIAVGFIRAKDLIPRARIAFRDFAGSEGYQRLPSQARVNKLAHDLKDNKVDLPTALLLNFRDYVESVNLVRDSNGSTLLKLGDDEIWEVDGQHRSEAIRQVLEENYERFQDYTIPFVIGLGWTEEYEMEQFFVVNSNQKSVSTTLAFDILTSLGNLVPGLMQDLEESGKAWQVNGQELAEVMAATSLIWAKRIRFSNEQKGMTTVSSAGFVNSLKPILNSPYFGRLKRGAQAKVLTAFWDAQRIILPEVFPDPQAYVLQKSLGVQVMHSIFNEVVEVVRVKGESVTDFNSYVNVMANAMASLTGDNREGNNVSGEAFWLSGERGAAGAFSSSAGRRVLTARLRSMLPKIGEV